MKIRLYFDEDTVRHALVEAVRKRGIDVETPLEVGMIQTSDVEQLEYAAKQGHVLYTYNMGDFCRLHTEWMRTGKEHAGIVCGRQQQYSVGEQIRRLSRLIATLSADAIRNQIEFLSSWG